MRMPPAATRLRTRIAFWALVGLALLVSHDAVFLAQLGPGESLAHALRHATHDYWGAASLVLALAGIMAVIAVAMRFRRLHRRASVLGARATPDARGGYVRRAARMWLALFVLVAIGFAVQENLEHAAGHGHILGFGALAGPEYPLALPVIALITLVGSLLGAAIASTERALAAAIAEVLRRLVIRAPRRLRRAPLHLGPRPESPLAGNHALRAPPLQVVSAS